MNINLKIIVFLLSLAATAFAITLGVAVGSGEYLIPSLVAAGFCVLFLMGLPSLVAAGAVATFACGLTLPGLPGQMKLFDAFAVLLIGICLLQWAMKTGKPIRFTRLDWVLVAFATWIFFIGCVRGFGFLAFGDDKIGGFNYLRVLLAASLVFTLPRVGIPTDRWKITLLLAGLLAPLTLVADLLVIHGWDFEVVRTFVQTSSEVGDMADASNNQSSMNRLWSAGPAANGMLIALLSLVPMRKFFQFTGVQWLAIFAGIVTLSLLSGFRLMTAMLLLVAALTLFFQKGFTAPRLLMLCIAGCVGISLVYLTISEFPNSVQRAVSWLPGISVSNGVREDANQTLDWRFQLWAESLRYFPDYWLVGKGFSYNRLDFMAAVQDQGSDSLKWALVVGAYHNGWLSMLLITGVIGTVLCLILLIAPVRRHWKRQYAPWNNMLLKRLHGVFLASLAAGSVVFLTMYGDVHVSFPGLFFFWAVLETLTRADLKAAPQSEAEAEIGEYSESTYQEA